MSSPSPQVKVPDLYRSSPASALQIHSISGMWPSQLFADSVPRSWSKNVLVSLAKIISSASTKADTTVDDVVAWFKNNAESCGGLNQEACTQADRWLSEKSATRVNPQKRPGYASDTEASRRKRRSFKSAERRAYSSPDTTANREELVRSEHISILREKSAAAEDRLNEAKSLLDGIEPRVVALQRQMANVNSGALQESLKEATARLATSSALVTKHRRYVDGYKELALPDAPTYHVQALETAQSELDKASQDAQTAEGVLASAQEEQRELKRAEEKLVKLGAEKVTLEQSVLDLRLAKARCDVCLGMVEYGPDGLAALQEEDVGAWKGMLDLE
ncbi:uncharacterized protein FFUJ_14092 [Fusarium fujikuroi IMI 58289]|uniref:Uncharacterized protein n=1 Tax=Gibberella fujikuroi (strain CBS 195.34 / IMI 58289 / NRRL A-6831) TaxID=1279085 RepID=S0ENF3_GIBF5|nr:uncharacterized protein FFUJ_14092 [Fusarium fujikuroi IMI 58289]CCT76272.1 uncharacterized protein FFUJ_14092 [Fusarium fujikuroi IMI 58289]